MSYMLIFLGLCIVLGLWSKPKAKRGWMVAALAVALVVFFIVLPNRM